MSVNKGLQGSEMVSNAFRSGIFTIRHVNSDDSYIYDGECDPLMIPTTPSVVLVNYLQQGDQQKRNQNATSKKMLQKLPTLFEQVQACNTYENLLNEIKQIVYLLYQAKQISQKVYKNILEAL